MTRRSGRMGVRKGETSGMECPACLTIKETFTNTAGAGNSYSRFVDVYICSECGRDEALRGFFWSGYCAARLIDASARRRGIKAAELIAMSVAFVFMLVVSPASAERSPYSKRFTWTGPYGGATTQCVRSAYGSACRTDFIGTRIGNDARAISVPDEEYKPASARTCASPSVVCLEQGR